MGVLVAPAIEQDLRRTGRHVRARLDRNEHQMRRSADPYAAEAHLDAADEVQTLDEDLTAVEASVAVGVLEDQDAIPALPLGRAHRIGVRLGHPESPAIVEREANGANDVRLGGGKLDRETLGHGHRLRGVRCREAGVPDRVHRRQRVDFRRGDLGGEERSRFVEAEVVEVDVRPRALFEVRGHRLPCFVVHQANHDVAAHEGLEVDNDRAQRGVVGAGDREDDVRVRVVTLTGNRREQQVDARARERATGDEEARIRLAHAEGNGGQRALAHASTGVAADPVAAGLPTLLVGALAGNDVALDEREGIAGRGPVVHGAALEIEVQHASVGHRRHAVRRHPRLVGDVDAALHARQPMAGDRTVVDVALGGRERDVGTRRFVENLRALDVHALERDVVHHQLAVDDGDAHRLARARPQRRVADTVDLATDPPVSDHRRLEDVFPIEGGRLGRRRLRRDVGACDGKKKDEDAEGHAQPGPERRRVLHGAFSPAVGYQI